MHLLTSISQNSSRSFAMWTIITSLYLHYNYSFSCGLLFLGTITWLLDQLWPQKITLQKTAAVGRLHLKPKSARVDTWSQVPKTVIAEFSKMLSTYNWKQIQRFQYSYLQKQKCLLAYLKTGETFLACRDKSIHTKKPQLTSLYASFFLTLVVDSNIFL